MCRITNERYLCRHKNGGDIYIPTESPKCNSQKRVCPALQLSGRINSQSLCPSCKELFAEIHLSDGGRQDPVLTILETQIYTDAKEQILDWKLSEGKGARKLTQEEKERVRARSKDLAQGMAGMPKYNDVLYENEELIKDYAFNVFLGFESWVEDEEKRKSGYDRTLDGDILPTVFTKKSGEKI